MNKFLLLFSLTLQALASNYTLVLLSQQRGASCIDGSPPGIYINEGQGQNKNKFLIYLEGGDTCGMGTIQETLEACYNRSKTIRGTSKVLLPSYNYDEFGYLSTQRQQNPVFWDWTKIMVRTCEGSLYIGNISEPLLYQENKLYFRGSSNVLETFHYLDETYDIFNQAQIVFTGESSGGIGTVAWANQLYDRRKSAPIYAIVDSGVFLFDFVEPAVGVPILEIRASVQYALFQNEEDDGVPQIIKNCQNRDGFTFGKCLNVQYLAQSVKIPTFYIQSVYDAKMIYGALRFSVQCVGDLFYIQSLEQCSDRERQIIENLRLATLQAMKQIKGERKDIGLWVQACVQHVFAAYPYFNDPNFKLGNAQTIAQAVEQFLRDPYNARSYIAEDPWPVSLGCSAVEFKNVSHVQKIFRDYYRWKRYAKNILKK